LPAPTVTVERGQGVFDARKNSKFSAFVQAGHRYDLDLHRR